MSALLAQIDAMGGISANWVLVVMTGIAGTLVFFQLREIKQSLSDISKLVQLHDKQIAVLESKQKDKENGDN